MKMYIWLQDLQGRGLMQAPGIGRALTELITTGSYQTIDISDFAVERVLDKTARPEPYVSIILSATESLVFLIT